jgi:hypothetical protein
VISRLYNVDSLAQPSVSEHPSGLQAYMDGRPGFAPIHPNLTDEYAAYHARYTCTKFKPALVYCLRNASKAHNDRNSVDFGSIGKEETEQAILSRGVAVGEDIHSIIEKLFGQWNTSTRGSPKTTQLIRVEAQLFRSLLRENNSEQRLFILTLWVAVCVVLGLERSACAVMAAAHHVGTHMKSAKCKSGLSLEVLYKEQRFFHDRLNECWDDVLNIVFETRAKLGSLKGDLKICMLHPAYSCPEKVSSMGQQSLVLKNDAWKQKERVSLFPERFSCGPVADAEGHARVVRNEKGFGLDTLVQHCTMRSVLEKHRERAGKHEVEEERGLWRHVPEVFVIED